MLYLSYGVYRSSFVFNYVFRLCLSGILKTPENSRNTPKKGVIRTPVEVEYKTICDAGMFSNKIIFRLTPNNQKE